MTNEELIENKKTLHLKSKLNDISKRISTIEETVNFSIDASVQIKELILNNLKAINSRINELLIPLQIHSIDCPHCNDIGEYKQLTGNGFGDYALSPCHHCVKGLRLEFDRGLKNEI